MTSRIFLKRILLGGAFVCAFSLGLPNVAHADTIGGDAADGEIVFVGGSNVAQGQGNSIIETKNTGGGGVNSPNAVLVFNLSSLNFSAKIGFANLDVVFDNSFQQGSFNVDLYGVGFGAAATGWESTVSWSNSTAMGGTLIQDNFVLGNNFPTAQGTVISTDDAGDTALINYLNTNTGGLDYVYFRLNPDSNVSGDVRIRSSTFPGGGAVYQLTAEPVPEPGSAALLGLGVLGAMVIRRRRRG